VSRAITEMKNVKPVHVAAYVEEIGKRLATSTNASTNIMKRNRHGSKVAGLCFDRFGDFEGFWLRTEHRMEKFHTRERDMESLLDNAWRQQIARLVIVDRHEAQRPVSIVFLRGHRRIEGPAPRDSSLISCGA
jgi:hypothetical protein